MESGVLRQTDQAYFHISTSPGGPCPDGSLETIFPPPSCLSCNMESLLSLSVSMLLSVVFNLQEPALIWEPLLSGWVSWLPFNQVNNQKRCEIKYLPSHEIGPLRIDWNFDDLLSSFAEKVDVSRAAHYWRSSSLVCKSMSYQSSDWNSTHVGIWSESAPRCSKQVSRWRVIHYEISSSTPVATSGSAIYFV